MPELPEVETIRRDLSDELLNLAIVKVVVNKPRMVQGVLVEELKKKLVGNYFNQISRIGKLLIFHLKSGEYMLIHLKMTGQLIFKEGSHVLAGGHTLTKKEDNFIVPNKYTHVEWHLKGNKKLYFNDLRQFGYVKLVENVELGKIKAKFGIEPLNKVFNGLKLTELLERKQRSNIKAAILDQHIIAGIGNIYADESCHLAHIRPLRRVSTLSKNEIADLALAIKKVLRLAVKKRGTTFNDYVDGHGRKGGFAKLLKVYGRKGEECLTCGKGKIAKIKIAGRGTCFCPACQH